MTPSRFRVLLLAAASFWAGPAAAQFASIPPGAYRTPAAYRHRQPQPAGTDAFFPDKRGQLVVEVPQGPRTQKLRISPDSVWGFASAKGRAFRIYRGEEYRLDFADTLCIYSSTITTVKGENVNTGSGRRYFFSRGLTGLIFPLTVHYLREAYAASNPAFVTALGQMRFDQTPSDFDRKTGLFRVTTIYREAAKATP